VKKIFILILIFLCFVVIIYNQLLIINLKKEIQSKDYLIKNINKELDNYKFDPAKIYAEIKMSYKDGATSESLKIKYDELVKYHSAAPETEEAKNLIDKKIREEETIRKKEIILAKKREKARKAKMKPAEKIMDRYGCSYREANLILNHKIEIGMDAKLCRASLGEPQNIQRFNYPGSEFEMWFYGRYSQRAVRIENKKVVSFIGF